MPIEITMPQLSDTMTEGTVVKWKKQEGEKVSSGEELADVETDKATMPMEAFDEGTLAAILVNEGQKVQVGQILAVIAAKGDDPAAIKKQYAGGGAGGAAKPAAKPAPAAAAENHEPGEEGQTREAEDTGPRPQEKQSAAAVAPADVAQEQRQPSSASVVPAAEAPGPDVLGGRIVASPLAKRMAADLGVDLSRVKGSGPNGRIVQKDVEEAAAAAKAGPAPTPAKPPVAAPAPAKAAPAPAPLPARVLTGQKQVVPMTKMRATIAQRLQASKQNLPHFYEMIDIACDEVLALRAKLNDMLEKEGVRLSLADFIAKALSVALLEHPNVNATFDGQQVTMHGDVNLGMAVALPGGLIVPVLRGVNQMGLKEIRQRTADLIDRARQQKLKQEEMSGGTFTISNLGNFGIRQFTAIINPPEVGILAIGAAEKRAVVEGDQIVAKTMMTVTLSADHRVLDGAAAAEFLRTFKHLMEEPGLMLV